MSADTDVVTTGTLVSAFTFATGNTTTVNGVQFTPFESQSTDTLVGPITANNYNGYGGFSGQSSEYVALTTGSYWDSGGTSTFTFNGLTPGTSYLVQVWAIDSRGCCDDGIRYVSLNGAINLNYNVGSGGGNGGAGNPGQFAVGTFTASGTSQSFTVAGNESAQINGL